MSTDFYFGAISPYSWFAAERIDALIPDAVWRPVFAGGLFRAAGRRSWGLDASLAPAKRADCEARALAHGLGPMRWPPGWPASDILIARALVVAESAGRLRPFALAAMRRTFRDGAALTEPAMLGAIADDVGLGGERLIAAVDRPEIKQAVRARTDAAVARGVVGVPSVLVGEAVYWGDDRLADAAQDAAAVR